MIRRYTPHTLYVGFLGGLIYFYATLLGGCGASALGAHAAAADATRTVNDTAVVAIETTCRDKADAAARNPDVTTDQATADAADVVATCVTIRDTQHTFAAAHTLWVSFLLQSIAAEEFDLQASLRLVIDLVRLYGEVVTLTATLGGELPELPTIVTQLLGDPDA
jgi:hypothetical protein